jgi:hypothetical protein
VVQSAHAAEHPILNRASLAVVLIAALDDGRDWLGWLDPLPPTLAILVGLSGIWQILRQQW